MPKCYSQEEKAYIKTRLKEEAAKCMALYGIRHTTVDELVRRVKIPKGTFYLFYQSKELLLFDVILEQHESMEAQVMEAIQGMDPVSVTCEQLTDVLFHVFKLTEEMPILKMMNSGEIEILARKLPENVLEEHLLHDNSMVEQMLGAFTSKADLDTQALSAAFRALYLVTLHREEIGEAHYDEVLKLLISGLVQQIL